MSKPHFGQSRQRDDKPTGDAKTGAERKAARLESEAAELSAIGRQVVAALGYPSHFHRVDVRHVGVDRYRVNVLVHVADEVTALVESRILRSYFVETDGDGNVRAATPRIVREFTGSA